MSNVLNGMKKWFNSKCSKEEKNKNAKDEVKTTLKNEKDYSLFYGITGRLQRDMLETRSPKFKKDIVLPEKYDFFDCTIDESQVFYNEYIENNFAILHVGLKENENNFEDDKTKKDVYFISSLEDGVMKHRNIKRVQTGDIEYYKINNGKHILDFIILNKNEPYVKFVAGESSTKKMATLNNCLAYIGIYQTVKEELCNKEYNF